MLLDDVKCGVSTMKRTRSVAGHAATASSAAHALTSGGVRWATLASPGG